MPELPLVTDPFAIVDAPGATQTAMADLLGRSDFVVCLAPANAETENMMNAQAFAAMRKGSYFINAARGDLVDDAALLQTAQILHGRIPVGAVNAELATRMRPPAVKPAPS